MDVHFRANLACYDPPGTAKTFCDVGLRAAAHEDVAVEEMTTERIHRLSLTLAQQNIQSRGSCQWHTIRMQVKPYGLGLNNTVETFAARLTALWVELEGLTARVML